MFVEGENILHGNDGRDTLYGGDKKDVIHGGNGDDLIFGKNLSQLNHTLFLLTQVNLSKPNLPQAYLFKSNPRHNLVLPKQTYTNLILLNPGAKTSSAPPPPLDFQPVCIYDLK
jgi:Ca2+-binding RTX toxin-like protein